MFTVETTKAGRRELTMNFPNDPTNFAPDVWIGLAHAIPRPTNDLLDGALGAYVNAVAIASSEHEFCNRIEDALNAWQFDVVKISDVERFGERERAKRNGQGAIISDDIYELVNLLTESEPVQFSTFNAYSAEDERDQ